MANANGGMRPSAPQFYTPMPKPPTKTRIAPMQSTAERKRQDKALKDLMAKRAAEEKRTGMRPNYYTN